MGHSQFRIFPLPNSYGVIKTLPKQPVGGLRLVRRRHLKVRQRANDGLAGGVKQRLVVGAVINEKFLVLIAGAEVAPQNGEEGLVERIALREAVDQLPEKERMTILLRYFKGLTQERAARVLGVSQVQVSRLERRGLERLRQSFAE